MEIILQILLVWFQVREDDKVFEAELKEAVAGLHSTSLSNRAWAWEKLQETPGKSLSTAQRLWLLNEATNLFRPQVYHWQKPGPRLVELALHKWNHKVLAHLKALLPQYHPEIKQACLQPLLHEGGEECLDLYLKIAAGLGTNLTYLPTDGLESAKWKARHVLPSLLRFGKDNDLRYGVNRLLVTYLEKGWVGMKYEDDYPSMLRSEMEKESRKWRNSPVLREPDGRWTATRYHRFFWDLLQYLEMMGYLPGDQVNAELKSYLGFPDTRIQLEALCGLLRKGQGASTNLLMELAGDPVVRNDLYRRLVKMEKENLFPKNYLTQAYFAEGHLVEYLSGDEDLDLPPTELELVKVVAVPGLAKRRAMDFYVFRFKTRDPEYAAEGWMPGVSGPFLRSKSPTVETVGWHTWSSLTGWSNQSAEQEVEAQIQNLLTEENKNIVAKFFDHLGNMLNRAD